MTSTEATTIASSLAVCANATVGKITTCSSPSQTSSYRTTTKTTSTKRLYSNITSCTETSTSSDTMLVDSWTKNCAYHQKQGQVRHQEETDITTALLSDEDSTITKKQQDCCHSLTEQSTTANNDSDNRPVLSVSLSQLTSVSDNSNVSCGCAITKKQSTNTNNDSTKRKNYLSWDDYFMATAILSSYRSKDPNNPTGACIVDTNTKRVIGIGYNGFPIGCSDDMLPWTSSSSSQDVPWLHTNAPYVVSAIVNAILNKSSIHCIGATLYTVLYPSNEDAKIIIQSGIKHIVYMKQQQQQPSNKKVLSDDDCDDSTRACHILFGLTGICSRLYKPSSSSFVSNEHPSIVLNFSSFNTTGTPTGTADGIVATPVENRKTSDHVHNKDDEKENHGQVENDNFQNKIVKWQRDLLWTEANYDVCNRRRTTTSSWTKKNANVLSWDDYYMGIAFLTAQRSKDPNTQVGACIVNPISKVIVGVGYNGFPVGCSDDELPWSRSNNSSSTNMDPLQTKYMYVVHAEVNAILNKGSTDVNGSVLYVALFPCNECAKVIIQSGIREVIYMNDPYHETDACIASRTMFRMAGVMCRRHVPTRSSIELLLY